MLHQDTSATLSMLSSFLCRAKRETVSHLVTTNQNGRALQSFFFRNAAYFSAGNYLRCRAASISTESSSGCKEKKRYKAIMTTSVSTVTIDTFRNSLLETSRTGDRKLLSASSWLHCCIAYKLVSAVLAATSSNDVVIMVILPVPRWVVLTANILNSSFLLPSCHLMKLSASWGFFF